MGLVQRFDQQHLTPERDCAAALVGTRGLQAQGNNTNYVQYNFGTAAKPATATYDARFYFRPNGNTSTGKDILCRSDTNFSSAHNCSACVTA